MVKSMKIINFHFIWLFRTSFATKTSTIACFVSCVGYYSTANLQE